MRPLPWLLLASLTACTTTKTGDTGSGDTGATHDTHDTHDTDTNDTDTNDTDTNDTDTNDTDTNDTSGGPDGDEVTVTFTGSIATVSGTPFGFDDGIRDAAVTGTFTFDPDVADDEPTDTMRSEWKHHGTGGFTFTIDGQELLVEGSGSPIVSEELYSYTWRFDDGSTHSDDTTDRTMKVNGDAASDVQLGLSLTPTKGQEWLTDAMLAAWPTMDPKDFAITFGVQDANGTFLMHLDTAVQTAP